jgi:hypothetical protein
MKISPKLRASIKLSETAEYKIAFKAGLHPSTLSRLVNGAQEIFPQDPRVVAVGKVLGLTPPECFEEEPGAPAEVTARTRVFVRHSKLSYRAKAERPLQPHSSAVPSDNNDAA